MLHQARKGKQNVGIPGGGGGSLNRQFTDATGERIRSNEIYI
jgi:hypothetical protein